MNSENHPQPDAGESQLQRIADEIKIATDLHTQDPAKGALHASTAMNLAREIDDLDGYGRAVRVRAMAYGAMGDLDSALRDFCEGAEHAELTGDLLLKAQCLHGIANVHSHRGDFGQAIEILHQSITLRRKVGDQRGTIMALNNIGACLAEVGSYADAVSYFTESLDEARASGSMVNAIITLTNIGHMKIECREDEAAIAYLRESIRYSDETGDRIYRAMPLTLLSRAYLNLDRLEDAIEYAQSAIDVAHSIGNAHLELEAWSQLGHAQLAQGDPAAAEESQLHALNMARKAGNGQFLAGVYAALGRLYLRIGAWDKARIHLQSGIEVAEQTHQKQLECELYKTLSEVCAADGCFEEAYALLRKSGEMNQALDRVRAHTLLIAHSVRQELATARQEAEIHRLKTVELAEANRENAALLAQLQQHADQLAELVIRDPLTGLYNRRYLKDFILQALENPRHADGAMTIAIADLDNFKQVNDKFSHQIGDEVLKATARLLASAVREVDIVVRYGGEEFVVVMPGIRRTGAARIAERMRKAISERDWSEIHPRLRMTVSIGLADIEELGEVSLSEEVPDPAHGKMEQLLAHADRRLYMAKETGKNRTCWK